MARATLEMFLKLTGADKTSRGLDKVSNSSKKLDTDVKNTTKSNAQFAAGMSSLAKGAIAGAALFAGKQLLDFAQSSIAAASAAQEAAGAFTATFGTAAQKLEKQLSKNASLFGLTTSEAKQLTGTLGAVAQGIGFTQGESADLSARLFELSGDIASFNNITAGAEPVLQAFRSAIVGERESLKTYGIAIGEAEVQTKAFEMTGKSSADELTRQEKALATVELAFAQAGVQIGNAQRESEGYAAQVLQSGSATRELKEAVGEELLPAAGELIGVFNSFVNDVSPAVISAFGLVNDAIVGTIDATEKGTAVLGKYFRVFILGQAALLGNEKAAEDLNKVLNENSEILNENSVQVFNATGFSQDFFDVLALGRKGFEKVNDNLQTNRILLNILNPSYKKFGKVIDKDVLPFAEKLAGVLGISNQEIKELTDLQKDRDEAQKDLNRALEEEGLITAQEALRKKELQQEIAELNFFQRQGKDVTEELAVAQEELKLIELALQRESDQLVEARKRATEAQQELDKATGEGTTAVEEQLEAVNNLQSVMDLFETENFRQELLDAAKILNFDWKEALDGALQAYFKFREQVTGKKITQEVDEFLKDLDEQGLLVGGFEPSSLAGKGDVDFEKAVKKGIDEGFIKLGDQVGNGVDTDAALLGDQSNVINGKNAGGDTNQTFIFELDGDEIQRFNTKLQQQGKTFQIR